MSVLLAVIDMYKANRGLPGYRQLKKNVLHLIRGCEERDITVIYVTTYPESDAYDDKLTKLCDYDPQIAVQIITDPVWGIDLDLKPDSLVVLKARSSAYKALEAYAAAHNISRVLLAGTVEMECIRQTAIDFARNRYGVTIVAEATESGVVTSDFYVPLYLRRAFTPKPIRIDTTSLIFTMFDTSQRLRRRRVDPSMRRAPILA